MQRWQFHVKTYSHLFKDHNFCFVVGNKRPSLPQLNLKSLFLYSMKSSASVNDIISEFDQLCLTNRLKEIRLRKQHLQQEEHFLQQLASPPSPVPSSQLPASKSIASPSPTAPSPDTPILTAAIVPTPPEFLLDKNKHPLSIGDRVELQSRRDCHRSGFFYST